MLDVERGTDVDPGMEQFLHVLVPLAMARAGSVLVRQLVDEHARGLPREHGIQIQFPETQALMLDDALGKDLQTRHQLLRLAPSVRLDDADDEILSSLT